MAQARMEERYEMGTWVNGSPHSDSLRLSFLTRLPRAGGKQDQSYMQLLLVSDGFRVQQCASLACFASSQASASPGEREQALAVSRSSLRGCFSCEDS